MKDSEPVGEHLGKDEDVKESPGLSESEAFIRKFKSVEVGISH